MTASRDRVGFREGDVSDSSIRHFINPICPSIPQRHVHPLLLPVSPVQIGQIPDLALPQELLDGRVHADQRTDGEQVLVSALTGGISM
jgi:hypothetical protein